MALRPVRALSAAAPSPSAPPLGALGRRSSGALRRPLRESNNPFLPLTYFLFLFLTLIPPSRLSEGVGAGLQSLRRLISKREMRRKKAWSTNALLAFPLKVFLEKKEKESGRERGEGESKEE